MTVLSKLASAQGRNDEQPNKDLGKALAKKKDKDSIIEKLSFEKCASIC